MFNFIQQTIANYDKTDNYKADENEIAVALNRLGISSGYDPSGDQFGNQREINSFYDNIVWVYRCVDFIASNLARLPWKIVKTTRNEGEIDYSSRPQFSVFNNPNNWQTPYDFKMESFARLNLQGELFWEIQRGPNTGQIIGLYPDWRSEEVDVVGSKTDMIRGYKRTLNGVTREFTPDQVFYIKRFNPFTNLRGLSPLRSARHTSELELNATFFNKQFFKQGARPSAILTTDQHLTDTEQTRLERIIHNKYSSVDEMHKIAVMFGGLKWTSLNSMSMADMQFKDLKMMNRQEIVSAFGLSLEVLGIGEKTYENVKYYRRMAWTETLMPLNEKVISFLNKKLLPALDPNPAIKLKADYSNVEALKEDREKKRKDYVEGVKLGALTRNEMRKDVFDKEPLNIEEMNKPVFDLVHGAGQGAGGGGSSEGEQEEQT